uniref:Uncharacterized protein n=1 Tax=Myotis myotis TaxID=51298 RepID=A0A7J7WHH2_MYOMY|nr:hypothetical protein mMyoMyo1_012042 [Myotis myotis]
MRLQWAQEQVSVHPPQPCLAPPTVAPWSLVHLQPHSRRCCSHMLMEPALLAPADGAEQLRLAQAVDASGGCCPNHPSGAGGGGKALRDDRGQQPPFTPADGAKQSGPTPGAGSGCERWLRCWQQMRASPALAAGVSARWDCGMREQRIFSNHQRLAPMTATGALLWSGVPTHLLYHPAAADTHYVLHSATCCQRLPCSAHAPWWSVHVIATGCSVFPPLGLFAY